MHIYKKKKKEINLGKICPQTCKLSFGLVECPTSVKVNNASYEKASKRIKALQGQREKWAYFVNCTVRKIFISWGNKCPHLLLTYKALLKQFRDKGLLLKEYGRKVGEHILSCVPQNSLPTHFNYQYLYSYFHMKCRCIRGYCCSKYLFRKCCIKQIYLTFKYISHQLQDHNFKIAS